MKAAGAFLRRLTIPAGAGRNSPVSGRIVGIVEVALVLLLAAASARLIWALFGPGPVIDTVPPPNLGTPAIAAVGNPFRLVEAQPVAAEGAALANVETTLDVALHGTWVDPEKPSAIIRLPDGSQKTFFVGDEICCGASLAGVYADQVTILRNGAHEALRLPNKGLGTEQAASVEAPAPQSSSLARVVQFRPMSGDGVSRLQLFAGDDAELFQGLGFRDGDILVTINNQPAPNDLGALAQLLEGLQGSRVISVTVERDGVRFPLDIPLEGAPMEPNL